MRRCAPTYHVTEGDFELRWQRDVASRYGWLSWVAAMGFSGWRSAPCWWRCCGSVAGATRQSGKCLTSLRLTNRLRAHAGPNSRTFAPAFRTEELHRSRRSARVARTWLLAVVEGFNDARAGAAVLATVCCSP